MSSNFNRIDSTFNYEEAEFNPNELTKWYAEDLHFISRMIRRVYSSVSYGLGNFIFSFAFSSGSVPVDSWVYDFAYSPKLNKLIACCAAVGDYGIISSSDGENWTGSTLISNASGTFVLWCPGIDIFVLANNFNDSSDIFFTSSDGENWTEQTVPFIYPRSLCYSSELSLILVSGDDGIYSSPDGENWTKRSDFVGVWDSITWSPELGLFVAVSNVGTDRLATSPDGENWTLHNIPSSSWIGVTWSPELGLFVAVASGGDDRIIVSSNGLDWSVVNPGFTRNWRQVTWSPELGLFVAVSTSDTGRVATSPDGLSWIIRNDDTSSFFSSFFSPRDYCYLFALSSSGILRTKKLSIK